MLGGKSMKASEGGVYTVYNKYLKCYTACQVVYISPPDNMSKKEQAVILSLDWVGNKPLTPEELYTIKPLYKDFMYWSRELNLIKVETDVPQQYFFVGILPPFTNEPCYTFGNWDNGYEMYLQMKWQAIPYERRKAFKDAMVSTEETKIGENIVKVSSHMVIDKYVNFDSAFELEKLPCLSSIICEKWHYDLIEFLRSNPFINELTLLNHHQKEIDLRGTSIRKLMIDMTELNELWLGEYTEELLFQNKNPDNCLIHAEDNGSMLLLQFIEKYSPHHELYNLKRLHGIKLKEFDISEICNVHPHLKELRLWGNPGNLDNFSCVSKFKELRSLSTYDLFGFSENDLPSPNSLPELDWLWMTSLPEEAAKKIKSLWKKKSGISIRITKPRKPEWLAQNLDNPFRNWDGVEHIPKSAAKKAANQYRKTRSQLIKMATDNREDIQNQAFEAIISYTEVFNKMRFIETEERDEIYMALCGILESMPECSIEKKELLEKFEEYREF